MQCSRRFALSHKGSLVPPVPEAMPTPLPFAVLLAALRAPLLATPEDEDADEDEEDDEDEESEDEDDEE